MRMAPCLKAVGGLEIYLIASETSSGDVQSREDGRHTHIHTHTVIAYSLTCQAGSRVAGRASQLIGDRLRKMREMRGQR